MKFLVRFYFTFLLRPVCNELRQSYNSRRQAKNKGTEDCRDESLEELREARQNSKINKQREANTTTRSTSEKASDVKKEPDSRVSSDFVFLCFAFSDSLFLFHSFVVESNLQWNFCRCTLSTKREAKIKSKHWQNPRLSLFVVTWVVASQSI